MKVGIYTNAFRDKTLEEALKIIAAQDVHMIELGCGEESGFAHCNPSELLSDEGKFLEFKALLERYKVSISALSCHGNPLSPNEKTCRISREAMEKAVLLAEKLGIHQINCFSGCPGDCEDSALANWITVSWPMDYEEAYRWQWEEWVIPFWKSFTEFSRKHGVSKIALELHPGQCCFNPKSVKRLREICGPEIGVNLDYSHLLWQRMDPILILRELEGMIYHMHAKDIMFDEALIRENGLINTDYFDEPRKRSWNFRTIGHGVEFWRNIFAELRRTGYDYVASIEMECEILTIPDAFEKAVRFLKECLPSDLDPEEESWQHKTHVSRLRRFAEYGLDTIQ